ncbi:SET domain-containing protein-lysine N-methyltransferase [Gracilimonas sp.]|uniref:SET domain-containing protein-lysine N-methyltransferase n=1 Tax=Gracilimonas sp. TaxID=1974203 RepID=UPI00374FF462
MNTYSYRNSKGNFVLCWDKGRFVNHSFKPNCMSTAHDFELAIRNIQPGEELTNDYGYLNVISPFRPVDEGTKRKAVFPDDLLNFYKSWDEKVQNVFSDIIWQQQPLKPLISDELWDKIHSIIEGREEMESILVNYFRE